MADNLTTQTTVSTVPQGTIIATDDAGAGGHVQVVKLAVSTNGSATPLTADNTDGLLVNLGANNDISGTVTANLGATDNAVLDSIQAAVEIIDNAIAGNEMQVDVLTMPTVTVNSHAVTNAGTFAVQESGSALTALQLIDDTVFAEDVAAQAADKGVAVLAVRRDADTSLVGTDNDYANLQVDANGYLKVEIFDGGGSHTVDGTVTANLAAGTNNIGDVDVASIAAGDNNIGNVDIVTLPAIPAGTNNIGDVDVLTLPAIPAGTNAVGKLLPPDVDVTAHTNYAKKYYTNAGAVTDGIVWSPAAGKRWHVVSMYLNVSAAATVTLEDDKAGGDEAVWKGEYAANSGVTIHFGENYPLASGEDAADLIVTTTAGNIYLTITGYEV